MKAPTPAMVKCSKAGKNVKKRVKVGCFFDRILINGIPISKFREFKKHPKEFRIRENMPKAGI